jgi:hypothetical protein
MFTINGQVDPVTNNELYSSPKPILVNSPTLASTSQQPDASTKKTFDGLRINLQPDAQESPHCTATTTTITSTTTSTSQTNMDDFEIKQPIGKINAKLLVECPASHL